MKNVGKIEKILARLYSIAPKSTCRACSLEKMLDI